MMKLHPEMDDLFVPDMMKKIENFSTLWFEVSEPFKIPWGDIVTLEEGETGYSDRGACSPMAIQVYCIWDSRKGQTDTVAIWEDFSDAIT